MKKTIRIFSILLALCMALSLGAFASGEASSGANSAEMAPPDVSTKGIGELGQRALLYIENVDGEFVFTEANGEHGSVSYTASEDADGITLSDVEIRADAIDFDLDVGLGTNGVTINAKDSDKVFTIGGEKDSFTVDGVGYNSVIVLKADPEEYQDSGDNSEMSQGGGVLFGGRQITLDNVYVDSEGFKRSAVFQAPSGEPDTAQKSVLVMKDSFIRTRGNDNYILPGFALSMSSARNCLLESGNVYVYGTTAAANGWGSLSLDTTTCDVYAVDSDIECLGHGYGIYSLGECRAFYYGVRSVSAQSAVTLCRIGSFYSDSLENVTEEALEPIGAEAAQKYLDGDGFTADYGGQTLLAGGVCAITNHCDMATADYRTTCVCKNTVISTADEDLVYYDGTKVDPVLPADYFLNYDVTGMFSGTYGGIGYFELKKVYGADIFTRSHCGYFEFENCEFKSSKDVIWQSMVTYDPMANGVHPGPDQDYVGSTLIFRDMTADGDILHEDYMRKLELELESAELNGAVVSGTTAAWNAWWEAVEDPTAAAEAQGFDLGGYVFDKATILKYGCPYDTYEKINGVRMTMDGDSVWTVTGDSSLYSLELADGAVIKAHAGKTLRIFVDVEMDNSDLFFDYATGTEVESLSPGSYTGVVILVEDAADGLLPVVEEDGDLYIRVEDLLDVLGRD